MTTDIHSCSYFCQIPECIKAQRDELRAQAADLQDTLTNTRAERDTARADRDHYGQQLADCQNGYETMEKEIAGLYIERDDWKSVIAQRDRELANLRASVEAYRSLCGMGNP